MSKRFDYYERLSTKDKVIYRASDARTDVILPDARALSPLVAALQDKLESGKRAATASAANALVSGLTKQLAVKPVKVHVRLVRPQLSEAELHGLYTFATDESHARIEVWMKTGAHERTVRFRTFLRTLLHEVCHHLDMTLLALDDSFHTQGFFQRESSLMRQLAPRTKSPKTSPTKSPKTSPTKSPKTSPTARASVELEADVTNENAVAARQRKKAKQLSLF